MKDLKGQANDPLNSLLAEATKVITFVCMDTSEQRDCGYK